jgi:hypothetical protein
MEKLFTFAIAAVVCLGTTAVLANNGRTAQQSPSMEIQMAANGAFRDGLFVGRLAAQSGRESRPLIGRWSSAEDRASFAAGYRRGYGEVASNATTQR